MHILADCAPSAPPPDEGAVVICSHTRHTFENVKTEEGLICSRVSLLLVVPTITVRSAAPLYPAVPFFKSSHTIADVFEDPKQLMLCRSC